jgi:hypothetical protein
MSRGSFRRIGAVIALLATAGATLVACGDDDVLEGASTTSTRAPVTTIEPGPTDTSTAPDASIAPPDAPRCATTDDAAPSLVVADGTAVSWVHPGGREQIAEFDDEVWLAFAADDGLVVASTRVGTGPESFGQGWIIDEGGRREIVEEGSPGVVVYELMHVDGAPVVVYGPIRDVTSPDAPESTPVVAATIDGSDRWGLGDAYAPEWGVTSASAAAGFVVFTAVSDLTESVFTTSDRDPLVLDDRFSPEPPYNSPPLVTNAVLHPDGSQLAWIEGPDWDESAQGSSDDPWQLVVADARTGEERFRRSVLGGTEAVLHVDWDGERAVISRFDAPPMLVDTADDRAALVELCDVTGTATLPRPRG